MFCSHCGYELDYKKIKKIVAKDAANFDNIDYLYKSLLKAVKKYYKNEIKKFKNAKGYEGKVFELKNQFENEINEINAKKVSKDINYFKEKLGYNNYRNTKTLDSFVCPRCGHEIKSNLNEEETKSLARAAHSEIHRGRNNVSSGMCLLMIGLILAIIGFLFLALSFKATMGGALDSDCVEFYVFIVLVVFGAVLIIYAIYNLIIGKRKIYRNENLLRDMNNGVFHQ